MSTISSEDRTGIFQAFNAVDLVTVAVFAALYRALWYVWHALSFLFPFNQILNPLFFCMVAVAAMVIVRKPWTATLVVVASMAINLFMQGEALVAAVIYLTWAIPTDLYFISRLRAGASPFDSTRDLMIGGSLLSVMWTLVAWVIVNPLIFFITFRATMLIITSVVLVIGGVVGAALGMGLGRRMQGLLG